MAKKLRENQSSILILTHGKRMKGKAYQPSH